MINLDAPKFSEKMAEPDVVVLDVRTPEEFNSGHIPSAINIDIYSDYLISQNHYSTSTGLANMFQGEISYDQMTRHLRSKDYSSFNF